MQASGWKCTLATLHQDQSATLHIIGECAFYIFKRICNAILLGGEVTVFYYSLCWKCTLHLCTKNSTLVSTTAPARTPEKGAQGTLSKFKVHQTVQIAPGTLEKCKMHKEYSGEHRSAPRTVLAASPSQGGSGGSMTDVAVPLLIMANLQIYM